MSENKCWPENCVWLEPIWNGEGEYAETDPALLDESELDDDGKELMEIRKYFDEQVELGRLNPDYTLNEEYEEYDESWNPEKGEDFWDGEFFLDDWEEAMTVCINRLKIPVHDINDDPVSTIRRIINYNFINENILRQAFTRRAFQIEYGLNADGYVDWQTEAWVNATKIEYVRNALKEKGYKLDEGTGRSQTVTDAIKDFQKKNGLDVNGRIDLKTKQTLGC